MEDKALEDISNGFDYYEEKQTGLGIRFNREGFSSFEIIKRNPFFQIRYDSFRCLPVRRFPFMIHFEIEEPTRTVTIFAVVNTYLNPEKNWLSDSEK